MYPAHQGTELLAFFRDFHAKPGSVRPDQLADGLAAHAGRDIHGATAHDHEGDSADRPSVSVAVMS